jgi:hypothetical protein
VPRFTDELQPYRPPTAEVTYSRLPFFRNRSKRGDCAARGRENAFFRPLRLRHYRCRPKSLILLATLETRTTTGMRQWSLSPYHWESKPHRAAPSSSGRLRERLPATMTAHQSIVQTSGPKARGTARDSLPSAPVKSDPVLCSKFHGPKAYLWLRQKHERRKHGLRRKSETAAAVPRCSAV